MLELPKVTLCCLTNQDLDGHKKAINKSCEGIKFGSVKLIWDEECTSIGIWNERIIKDLPRYIDTEFALLIHADGYVINPHLWRDKWLEYDYIGAPWPLPQDDYSYRDEFGVIQRIGNGVSLRSKKLMELAAARPMKYRYGNNNEDGHICCWNRRWLRIAGCEFAPLEEAIHFSKEHEIPENVGLETFAFHQVDK
jgi:hypothetical protein